MADESKLKREPKKYKPNAKIDKEQYMKYLMVQQKPKEDLSRKQFDIDSKFIKKLLENPQDTELAHGL